MAASAIRTTHARDPNVDVEGTGYGGTSSGGWTCGPTATARYAGGGLHVMVSQRPRHSPDGPGLVAVAGGSLDREQVSLESCPEGSQPGSDECPAQGPPSTTMGALHLRLGDEDRWFGFQVGVLGFQGWSHSTSQTPKWAFWPELRFRVGPPAIVYGVLGFGSDMPSTVRRPAVIYTGVGGSYDWGGFDARLGFNRSGPALSDDFSLRVDGVVRVRLLESAFLTPGLATQFADRGSAQGWEGSLGLEVGF